MSRKGDADAVEEAIELEIEKEKRKISMEYYKKVIMLTMPFSPREGPYYVPQNGTSFFTTVLPNTMPFRPQLLVVKADCEQKTKQALASQGVDFEEMMESAMNQKEKEVQWIIYLYSACSNFLPSYLSSAHLGYLLCLVSIADVSNYTG